MIACELTTKEYSGMAFTIDDVLVKFRNVAFDRQMMVTRVIVWLGCAIKSVYDSSYRI